ncbi:6107_t:CDS:2 [Funneliformis geosporum]|uniref:15012_t:CDS:1 n=1 Tax=Funneliformis geosporum TaxID=1117311 RepID=A0A9W4SQM0_9GLOM|nr:6107_t:CDS:2 [Funneliformis geosporum]CAI2178065.1 15012_t:CDS:2 [Funneliformis geosporum]
MNYGYVPKDGHGGNIPQQHNGPSPQSFHQQIPLQNSYSRNGRPTSLSTEHQIFQTNRLRINNDNYNYPSRNVPLESQSPRYNASSVIPPQVAQQNQHFNQTNPQINPQQINFKQPNQQIIDPNLQINSQQISPKQINPQQSSPQQNNPQQINPQQIIIHQQVNPQQNIPQKVNPQQINLQQFNPQQTNQQFVSNPHEHNQYIHTENSINSPNFIIVQEASQPPLNAIVVTEKGDIPGQVDYSIPSINRTFTQLTSLEQIWDLPLTHDGKPTWKFCEYEGSYELTSYFIFVFQSCIFIDP